MRSTAGTIQNWACRRSEKVLKKKREDFQNEEKSFERIIMCEHGSNHGSPDAAEAAARQQTAMQQQTTAQQTTAQQQVLRKQQLLQQAETPLL